MYLILFLLFIFIPPHTAFALDNTASVKINAAIDINQATVFGYTSPHAKVELNSIGVYAISNSDETGYFEFKRIILPKNYSELCINSIDESSRYSSPVCIPPPPRTNYFTSIGPIILPPTLTINNHSIEPNSTVATSGQAIPNSDLSIYFYKVDDEAKSFPKSVSAYSLPVYNAKSDANGNFNLNLPTAYSSNYRLYASTQYQDNVSPKSNTLIYNLPSLWYLFFLQHRYLFFTFPIFIFTLILFFTLLFLNHKSKISLLTPALRRNYSPAIYPEHLVRSNYIPE